MIARTRESTRAPEAIAKQSTNDHGSLRTSPVASPLSNDRPASLGGERVERILHDVRQMIVDLVTVGVPAEPRAHVDRLEHLSGGLFLHTQVYPTHRQSERAAADE